MFKVIGTELYFNNNLVGTLFDHDKITPTLRDDAMMALYGVRGSKTTYFCQDCGELNCIEV